MQLLKHIKQFNGNLQAAANSNTAPDSSITNVVNRADVDIVPQHNYFFPHEYNLLIKIIAERGIGGCFFFNNEAFENSESAASAVNDDILLL